MGALGDEGRFHQGSAEQDEQVEERRHWRRAGGDIVGNVNVNDGGQAIVGAVNHPGPGKVSKDNEEKKVG